MAYLRGNSYVDGNLIVEGALQVKRLTMSGSNFPYLVKILMEHVPLYSTNDGGLEVAPIRIATAADKELSINHLIDHRGQDRGENPDSINPDYFKYIHLETTANKIKVFNAELELEPNTYTWKFKETQE